MSSLRNNCNHHASISNITSKMDVNERLSIHCSDNLSKKLQKFSKFPTPSPLFDMKFELSKAKVLYFYEVLEIMGNLVNDDFKIML